MRCDGMSSQWSVISKHTHTQQIQVFGWKFQKRKKKNTDVVESVLFWLVVTCYKMDLIFNFTIGNYVSTYFEKKTFNFSSQRNFSFHFPQFDSCNLACSKDASFLNNDFKNVFLPFKKRQKFRRHDIFHISLPKLPQSFSQHYIVKNLIWHF